VKILYGAVGEGLGHATRSSVVAEHLVSEGHEVKMAASGRALPYLRERLADVEEIWGMSFVLEEGQVDTWRTVRANVRGGLHGIPVDARLALQLGRSYGPDLVITDFDGFAYTVAKLHRVPVLSIDNIQMVDRCRHDAELLQGIHRDYMAARAFVGSKLPRATHYLITTFFYPPLRKKRTTLMPPILRPEIVAAQPEPGDSLLVYGRLGDRAATALKATGVPCLVYGARDGLEADERDGNLVFRPFSNEGFVEDLRTCRGVVASAGFSLMSEVVYLRKPMLAVPLAHQFEQEMNARYLERLGYGMQADAVDEASLERFLAGEREHAESLAAYEQHGNVEALETIDRVISELIEARAAKRPRLHVRRRKA
jgi:uncharacterized protein (TIGR00661 family)